SLDTLVNLTGASLVADYALIAIAALVARPTGATSNSPYKMPLWPLPPILALLSLGYIFTKQTSLLLWVTLITIGIGLLYWLVVIFPQRGRAWNLREAAIDEAAVGQDRQRHGTGPARPARGDPGGQAARPLARHPVRRRPRPLERDHRRAWDPGRLHHPDPGRLGPHRGDRDPPARPGGHGRPGR